VTSRPQPRRQRLERSPLTQSLNRDMKKLVVSEGGNSLSLERWLTDANTRSQATGDEASSSSHYTVSVSAPDVDEAERLARIAVENRLAAYARVSGPTTSTYWWDGEVMSDAEWLCTLVTTSGRLKALTDALVAAHSFKVPSVIVTPIVAGAPAFLAWIDAETAPEVAKPQLAMPLSLMHCPPSPGHAAATDRTSPLDEMATLATE